MLSSNRERGDDGAGGRHTHNCSKQAAGLPQENSALSSSSRRQNSLKLSHVPLRPPGAVSGGPAGAFLTGSQPTRRLPTAYLVSHSGAFRVLKSLVPLIYEAKEIGELNPLSAGLLLDSSLPPWHPPPPIRLPAIQTMLVSQHTKRESLRALCLV